MLYSAWGEARQPGAASAADARKYEAQSPNPAILGAFS